MDNILPKNRAATPPEKLKAPAPGAAELAEQLRKIVTSYDRVALVFQGGGALGAYQAGVFAALSEIGAEPNWLSGVSIGAINASIIAGNKSENRLAKLNEFWSTVSGRNDWDIAPAGDMFRAVRNQFSAFASIAFGQPGFFSPRFPGPWSQPPGTPAATSYYDTAPLRATLERVIDFDILNDQKKRLSVGAVNLRTGNFVYFDTLNDRIGPEHIMASGALPPALPPVAINGDLYWDGGIVSNTPLQYLLDQEDQLNSLVFQVDLFSARGAVPRDMRGVNARQKDITYSSRTRYNTDTFKRLYALRRRLGEALARIPAELRTPEENEQLKELKELGSVNIVHLIYQQKDYEGSAKDYEFSGMSMREHWQSGYDDTKRTLHHPEWLMKAKPPAGLIVHDVHED